MKNQISNKQYLRELIKRSSKVHENHMSCEYSLNSNQWKRVPENYKPIRVRYNQT